MLLLQEMDLLGGPYSKLRDGSAGQTMEGTFLHKPYLLMNVNGLLKEVTGLMEESN